MDNQETEETVYGTHEDSHLVMSERVQSLAGSIYKEFERMIKKYDEDVVKELMPLVVGILEGLDHSYNEKQENDVELELLRDDNEQLLTQYEREKQLRKTSEQKILELEDVVEEERKELSGKVESLESIVRMFELKAKNAQDHISRLEDKENEMKKEYSKLHERYTDLFKTHMDHMERAKLLVGGERIIDSGVSPKGGRGFQLPSLRPVNASIYSEGNTPVKSGTTPPDVYDLISPGSRSSDSSVSLKHELRGSGDRSRSQMVESGQVTDSINVTESSTGTSATNKAVEDKANQDNNNVRGEAAAGASSPKTLDTSHRTHDTGLHETSTDSTLDPGYAEIITSPDMEELEDSGFGPTKSTPVASSQTPRPPNQSSIFDELSMHDHEALGEMDEGMDVTGMSKEVENLILENTELLATKNALNVVKDDLIAKVDELSSEQEILREEITSLQAHKEKLKTRVSELEEELKKSREELEKAKEKAAGAQEEGAEEDVPMAQRKRFTRVEMARVLMERNQYKERLMELQEAVRWTEMIRASREHPELAPAPKKKGSIWNFFSNLFSSTPAEKPKTKKGLPSASVKYNAPTSGVKAVGDPNKKNRDKYNMGEKAKAYDFLQDDLMTEKARKEREKERREQYKQVRAHVKKDDGRMQAYGWSLPAKVQSTNKDSSGGASGKSSVPVPVPVYCRPLIDKESNMKIWCAAGVNLSGGKTKDGGSVVGASVFYSNPTEEEDGKKAQTEVEKLDKELKEHEKDVKALDNDVHSSLLWICTTEHNSSQVSVVDANNPGDILDAFHVTSSHILCIASVPGAKESDYTLDSANIKCETEIESESTATTATTMADNPGSPAKTATTPSDMKIGGITLVQCATGATDAGVVSPQGSPPPQSGLAAEAEKNVAAKNETVQNLSNAVEAGKSDEAGSSPEEETTASLPAMEDPSSPNVRVIKATGTPATPQPTAPSSAGGTPTKRLLIKAPAGSELITDGLNSISAYSDLVSAETEKFTSVAPTMWLGSQSGSLYVHSAVSHWKKCLHSVKLKDSVLCIIHQKGRVFVGLADGTVAVFHRSQTGQWDLLNYHLIDLGRPHHSVRCMTVVGKNVWCAYRNKIHVVDPKTLVVEKSFDAHPRKESQVRQMAWVGDGVWVSIRLDSTLRLYHAYTHQHLQDVDIEPYVSKMLGTGKLGFSFVRITALQISCNRLWIGTGNGVIISVPLSEDDYETVSGGVIANKQSVTKPAGGGRPGGVIRVYTDSKSDSVTPGSFIPYCSMAQAQLSFHGHKDAVKFFASVPGAPSRGVSNVPSKKDESPSRKGAKEKRDKQNKTMLVISGGEGYIDFRIGDTGDSDGENSEDLDKKASGLSKGDRSHLVVWQVFNGSSDK